MDQHFNFDVGTKDFGRVQEIPYGNGNKFIVEQTNPYGFWKIKFLRGTIPEVLSGMYTEYVEAEKAIKLYVKSKTKEA